jgi:transcriptional/translational regulatory protein YebC/TACO1
MDEDEVMMQALEAGAEDFAAQDDAFEVYTAPAEFSTVREALEENGYDFISAELQMIPQNTVAIEDPETVEKVLRFLDKLDENDDVQEVFHNALLPEDA